MNPAFLQLAVFAISEGIKAYPQIKADIQAILSKENPTPEDWNALHAKIASESYFKFVPGSALPRS
jgi:hypothetical protein